MEGKQVTRKWTDKEGNERYSTELNANYVAKPVYAKKKVETKAPSYENGIPDSDIPFMPSRFGGLWRSVCLLPAGARVARPADRCSAAKGPPRKTDDTRRTGQLIDQWTRSFTVMPGG